MFTEFVRWLNQRYLILEKIILRNKGVYSPKYWDLSFTIRCFSFISRALVWQWYYINLRCSWHRAQPAGVVECTDCFSADRQYPTTECPGYDTKQSDVEAPVLLELWEMRITPSLPSLLDPLWLELVAPDRVLSMGQIELNCVLMLNWIAWKRTVLRFKLFLP